MEHKDSVKSYKAPRTKVVEVNIQGILCYSDGENSNGISDMIIDEDGGESFN